MRLLPLALLAGCATYRLPCEFPVIVRVTADAAGECEALGAVDHLGQKARNPRGCAPEGRIITNGTEANLGHEMKHLADRHCR